MGENVLRSEDRIGLAAAVVLHVALVAIIALQFVFSSPRTLSPERVSVSLATEVSLQSTAPDPVDESRASIAPTLSELPAIENEQEAAEPEAEAAVTPPPPSERIARTTPDPPLMIEDTRDRRRPDPRENIAAKREASETGGSRIGDNFLEGEGSSTATDETQAEAPVFGRRERAALASAITRQLRPHWNAPTGIDAERLVSTVTWSLNQDGSLRGRPRCRTASGVTDLNRSQAGLHCERAIRAVQLAAPFNLPEQFYNRWKDLEWDFDRRL